MNFNIEIIDCGWKPCRDRTCDLLELQHRYDSCTLSLAIYATQMFYQLN